MDDRERFTDSRYQFNYNREERQAWSSRKAAQKRETLFSRHRGTIIVLFDLVIIAVVFVVFRGFLIPEPHRETLGGYDFELQVVNENDDVVVRLRASRGASGEDTQPGDHAGFFQVRVPADVKHPAVIELFDLVPSGEQPRIVQQRVSRDLLDSETVTALVLMNDKSVTLSTRVGR